MDYRILKERIYRAVQDNQDKKLMIYPMGMQGALVKGILNGQMGIMEDYIIDNKLCNQFDWIYSITLLDNL